MDEFRVARVEGVSALMGCRGAEMHGLCARESRYELNGPER